jgi:hypothetical protein
MDKVFTPDHDHSGNDDWNLPFPPNPRISDSYESSDDDRSPSDGREGPAGEQFDYVDLHAVHDYRARHRGLRGASRGGSGLNGRRMTVQGKAMGTIGRRLNQDSELLATNDMRGGGAKGFVVASLRGEASPGRLGCSPKATVKLAIILPTLERCPLYPQTRS